MIVDDSAGLQMRIDCHLTNILKAPLLQILADPLRQPITDGDLLTGFVMSVVKDRLVVRISPDIIAEAPELLPDLLEALRVIDDSCHLSG